MILTAHKLSVALGGIFLAATFYPRAIWACAACFGQSDSPMAAGMNWGIFSLLGIIVVVLGGVAAFFIFLARRSAAFAKLNGGAAATVSEPGATSPSSTHPADPSSALLLAGRGGFGRVSVLAQQRQRCAHPQLEQSRRSSPRSRS